MVRTLFHRIGRPFGRQATAAALAALLLAILLPGCAGQEAAVAPRRLAAGNPTPTVSSDAPPGFTIAAPRPEPDDPVADAPLAISPDDPLEATNRDILDFNLRLDNAVIKPVALFYRNNVGAWTRTRVRNVLDNMQEPRFLANNLLQGRPLAAGENLMRFTINSTLGLGGMFDMAQFGGPARAPRDFGQTLALWGVPDGPYLMWPIAGPSNPRDSVGFVVNGLLDPIDWVLPFYGLALRGAAEGLDAREQNIEALEELQAGSLDFYARLRSVWRQRRDAELGRVSGEAVEVLDDPGVGVK